MKKNIYFIKKIIKNNTFINLIINKKQLISEIKIHRSLIHDKVVKFERVFEDSENVYILLELCTN